MFHAQQTNIRANHQNNATTKLLLMNYFFLLSLLSFREHLRFYINFELE